MSDDKKKKKPGKRKTPAPGTPAPTQDKEDISGVFDLLEGGGVPDGAQRESDISRAVNTLGTGGKSKGDFDDVATTPAPTPPDFDEMMTPAPADVVKPGDRAAGVSLPKIPSRPASDAGVPVEVERRNAGAIVAPVEVAKTQPFESAPVAVSTKLPGPAARASAADEQTSPIEITPPLEPSKHAVPARAASEPARGKSEPARGKSEPARAASEPARGKSEPARASEPARRPELPFAQPRRARSEPAQDAVPAPSKLEPTAPVSAEYLDQPTTRLPDKLPAPVLITPRRADSEERVPTGVYEVARPDSEPGVPKRDSEPGIPKRDSEPDGIPRQKVPFETKPFQLQSREPASIIPPAKEGLETKPLTLPTKTPASDEQILEADAVKWDASKGEKPKLPAEEAAPARASDKIIELTAEPSKSVRLPPGERGLSSPAGATLADKLASTSTAEKLASAPTSGASATTSTAASTTAATTAAATTAAAAAAAAAAATAVDAADADDIESTETSTEDKSDVELVDWVAPDDGFMLADEVGDNPQPALAPSPPVLPSPQEAALEAARIVSQMVDIDSESGAMIAAAAAAGAAIEAAAAAQRAQADPRASQPSMRIPPEVLAGQSGHDPVATVRLSRDRILAALAEEDIAVPVPPSARESQPSMPQQGRIRARTEPGIEDGPYEDFDPVAIAAAAIGRLRARARTDLAELRVHYHRHDIFVLLLALVIIIAAGRVHQYLVTPPVETFSERGLTFEHSTNWLKPEPMPPISPRLVRDPTGATTKDENLYHVEMAAIGSNARIEIQIDKKPTWSNIVTGLELDRRSRWGELYTLDASTVRAVGGHDWLRTRYRYAHVVDRGDVPRVDHAVEYATIDREQIYVVTLFGTPLELEQMEDVIAPTLKVPSQTGLPLVPQTSRLSQRKYPGPVGRAFESTVMVVAADLVDGRLKARGGGSGVIVGGEGSILTNYHVIHDKDGRLHDVFIIGRFSAPDRAPQLQCAGRPSRSKLSRELDLALIKCDMDLDGRTWSPNQSSIWATLPEARASDVKIGQRLWVLGYPDVGGGGLTLSAGEVEGWTGEDGAQGKDFIKTDASITHGNSGGPVIDDNGRLVGIAAAYRTRVTANNGVIETSQIGLVRPLQTASNLLAYATAGWTPREGYTDVELTPTAVEAAAEGIRIFTTVIDDANEQPVRDATVMVLKAGVDTANIDMNRLDDQAIAWGKTNALGEVRLKQLVPVPGTYTVMVIAPGYEPLIGENELKLDENTPPRFDPWGRIGLRAR